MMRNDSDVILDDLLSRWHSWARGFQVCPEPGADPMFRNAKSSRGWDSIDDIVETELNSDTMEAIEFEVNEMADPHRSAIHVNARNLACGHLVWSNPRLPRDPAERALVIFEARILLTKRLLRAGIM